MYAASDFPKAKQCSEREYFFGVDLVHFDIELSCLVNYYRLLLLCVLYNNTQLYNYLHAHHLRSIDVLSTKTYNIYGISLSN